MINAYAATEPGAKLEAYQYDPGELGEHEVEIEVHYCGICHSDLSMIDNEWGLSEYPLVPGHEVVGKVAQVGERVTEVTPGQVVGLGWHSDYCHQCAHCHSGEHNLCQESTMTIVGHHGGFADKVRADATSVIPIPDGVDLKSAGPLFCGGITVFNPLTQFNIKPTDKVAVIGIGGLGHMALQFLNAWGCEVTAFTSSEAKKQEALELGAHHTLNSRDEKTLEEAAGQFDMILSTVNVKLDWNLYLNTLKPKGRLHFVGAALEPLDINVFNLIMGQRSVSGSPVGSPATITEMLDFSQRHGIKPMVQTYKFDQVNEALDQLRSGDVRYRLVLER
ncbi:putative cinnamyl alcohol dehydrogenase [Saliniradius amylolyticus]|uniref:alcohol dehydrogenase (NADP(+)) n=1 Tax=Saliniradius amylolyticus TaxID=2183582 RepID=A0A2S2DZ57_9ALTE|nr:NAD(P)-dependent alcohol dehydrogenase [Saliniradius amylolyticus]AWL10681.1 putative cinnamyl alcohol dehydrogenase [Saliniradius amylolyticus]